jgi:hypothetical protein
VKRFTRMWRAQKVTIIAKSRKNSRRKASYALPIHLILLTWAHETFDFLKWPRKKWEIGNFTQLKIFSAAWRRSGMTSLSKTSDLYSLSGRSP